jgi:hypothetical protein
MRITLDPWGGDPASQITVPYKIDSADTSVLALDDPIEDRPWAPVVPAPPFCSIDTQPNVQLISC